MYKRSTLLLSINKLSHAVAGYVFGFKVLRLEYATISVIIFAGNVTGIQ